MSSYRDHDQDPERGAPYRSSEPRVRPQLAAAALFRSAASNQTLNIDKFRPRSPSPERDPHIAAYLAAQEAARGSGAVSSSARGSRRERENLTAEENRARREREAVTLASASASGSGSASTRTDQLAQGSSGSGSGNGNSSSLGLLGSRSRYQREKEEAERKARDAEEAAARAYEEFSAELAGPSSGNGRGRGSGDRYGSGRSSAGRSAPAPSFVSASSGGTTSETGVSPYVPTRGTATSASVEQEKRGPISTFSSATDSAKKPIFKRPLDMFGDDADDEPANEPVKAEPPGKRMRAMEDFLGELQRDQKAREERFKGRVGQGTSLSSILAFEGQRQGSRDLGDPLTTNVCVQNLPANITEEIMGNFFCQWGDVGTVKVMWPRGDEMGGAGGAGAGITMVRRMQSAGLTGFVSFMRREDAERAIRESDGLSWAGSIIRASWGKAMPIPVRPQYYAPKQALRERTPSPSSSRRPRGETADAAVRKHRTSRPRSTIQAMHEARSLSPRNKFQLKVEREYGAEAANVRTVAQRVQQHGPKFEELLREKEKDKDNPKFAFLWDEKSVLFQYYNMLLNPHFEPSIPLDPFTEEGDAAIYSSDSGEDSEAESLRKQRRDVIGSAALYRFMAMLRSLTPRRERIARCMMFALDHAHACDQVVDVLCQSLLIPSTPIPRKIARLYVVSDILHNSASPMPNVWKYRLVLEKRLPEVFEHLGDVGRSFPSRIKAESWKQMVGNVLSAWEAWLVFPSGVLEGLGAALLAPTAVARGDQSRFAHPTAFEDDEEDGEAIDLSLL
ncbi:unnamed protein product [Tilletia laevis]|uniref:U2 snRNP-associated SURP motif-containing protein n=3 Tax=Tilletia TaxID=13289 RepID=A0A8X7SXQ8_9BASI|nr:hypothetical protein CF336_g3442 [Tilletia laevis]KAE8199793.1 hypothetical protein CF328_g3146 [Tilletia controversa]KAE8262428.1 hypothetical protein A4X03_0g2461 [Tilletia caries]KAE8204715.1 hypothetical protein CF335_g2552 [Tilletia laevis]KAE8248170.1 hypothetical protein A4X06_0g3906 [Tilletia controversa]